MINLSITAQCNRDCSYCFALDVLATKAQTEMSEDVFVRALDLAERSGGGQVRLLGGEPTIHRRFLDYLDLALARGLNVAVLTGGLIPAKVIARLEESSPDRVSLLMNVVAPWEDEPAMHKRQRLVMARLGPRVALGLNIDRRGVELDFLLELIGAYELAPAVRLGLAHPIWKGKNAALKPKHYAAIGERVAAFAFKARDRGVTISFDCGWVPCMFPEGALQALDLGPREIGLRCSPILDVLVDGEVISCYPLAHHSRMSLGAPETTHDMRDAFRVAQTSARTATLFPHCTSCDYFRAGDCTGGCVAAALQRARFQGVEALA